MATKVTDTGTPAGSPTPSSVWLDSCAPDSSVSWPSSGTKNLVIESEANFSQEVPYTVDGEIELADAPSLQSEQGSGTELVVNGWIASQENIADSSADFSGPFNDCPDCGGFSNTRFTQYAVPSGQVGTIRTPEFYFENILSSQFSSEKRSEILLTDSSGVRGIRCGYAIRVRSQQYQIKANSQPGSLFVDTFDPSQTHTVTGFQIPLTMIWTVEYDFYIKTACKITDEFRSDRSQDYVSGSYDVSTSIQRTVMQFERKELTLPDGQWVTQSLAIPTSRSSTNDCEWGRRSIIPLVADEIYNCWLVSETTYQWSEPGSESFDYYQLPSDAIQTEFLKHHTKFWQELFNDTRPESIHQKWPVHGDIKMRVRKENAKLTLEMFGDYPTLGFVDSSVNRVMAVGATTGTTITRNESL